MELIKINIKDFNEMKKHKDYMCKSFRNPEIYCGFLPGHGTTLFFENMHFIVVDDGGSVVKRK